MAEGRKKEDTTKLQSATQSHGEVLHLLECYHIQEGESAQVADSTGRGLVSLGLDRLDLDHPED